MTPHKDEKSNLRPSVIKGILLMRCPSCRVAPMYVEPNPYRFRDMGKMNVVCPKCGQPIDTEAGYYFGAMYFSYALMVAWNFSIVIAVFIITGSVFDHFLFLMISGFISTLLISPIVFRYSRVLWSYMFFGILKNKS